MRLVEVDVRVVVEGVDVGPREQAEPDPEQAVERPLGLVAEREQQRQQQRRHGRRCGARLGVKHRVAETAVAGVDLILRGPAVSTLKNQAIRSEVVSASIWFWYSFGMTSSSSTTFTSLMRSTLQ